MLKNFNIIPPLPWSPYCCFSDHMFTDCADSLPIFYSFAAIFVHNLGRKLEYGTPSSMVQAHSTVFLITCFQIYFPLICHAFCSIDIALILSCRVTYYFLIPSNSKEREKTLTSRCTSSLDVQPAHMWTLCWVGMHYSSVMLDSWKNFIQLQV